MTEPSAQGRVFAKTLGFCATPLDGVLKRAPPSALPFKIAWFLVSFRHLGGRPGRSAPGRLRGSCPKRRGLRVGPHFFERKTTQFGDFFLVLTRGRAPQFSLKKTHSVRRPPVTNQRGFSGFGPGRATSAAPNHLGGRNGPDARSGSGRAPRQDDSNGRKTHGTTGEIARFFLIKSVYIVAKRPNRHFRPPARDVWT